MAERMTRLRSAIEKPLQKWGMLSIRRFRLPDFLCIGSQKSGTAGGPVSLLPRGMVGYVPQQPLKHLATSLEDELKELDAKYGEALGAVGDLQRPEAELGVLLESITRKGEQLKHVRQCLRK